MDPDRVRELLTAERRRIERALGRRGREDDSEPADEYDPGNLASDLYQDELDEGLGEDLREQLAAVERAEERLAAGTYGLSTESGQPISLLKLPGLKTVGAARFKICAVMSLTVVFPEEPTIPTRRIFCPYFSR